MLYYTKVKTVISIFPQLYFILCVLLEFHDKYLQLVALQLHQKEQGKPATAINFSHQQHPDFLGEICQLHIRYIILQEIECHNI